VLAGGRKLPLRAGRRQPLLWQDELDEKMPALAPLDDTLPPLQFMWLRSGPLFMPAAFI
jgi:hypothetical protein